VGRAPLWQRIFLDIILLGLSLYSLYRLNAQLKLQRETGIVGTEADLDFLLFLSSTIFILGAGLFFLRLYPSWYGWSISWDGASGIPFCMPRSTRSAAPTARSSS
jgi:putative ABC transport system permease protein